MLFVPLAKLGAFFLHGWAIPRLWCHPIPMLALPCLGMHEKRRPCFQPSTKTYRIYMEVSIHGGSPIAGWFISWKMLLKWVITRGTPILGNLHISTYHNLVICQGELGSIGDECGNTTPRNKTPAVYCSKCFHQGSQQSFGSLSFALTVWHRCSSISPPGDVGGTMEHLPWRSPHENWDSYLVHPTQ